MNDTYTPVLALENIVGILHNTPLAPKEDHHVAFARKIERAAIEAYQRQQWISVEDRLPDIIEWSPGSVAGISDPVLVYLDSEGESGSRMEVWSLRRGGRGDRTSLYWDWDSPKVTHWRPLPAAPDLPTAAVDNPLENPMTDLRQQGLARVEKTLSGDEP